MFHSHKPRLATAIAAIAALLLNAATPLLADAAAAMRGVPTGEICDVYGVRMPDGMHDHAAMDDGMAGAMHHHESDVDADADADAAPLAPHHSSHATHRDHCCTLTGLATFAAPGPGTLSVAFSPAVFAVGRITVARAPISDAAARWVLQRKHGPPVRPT